MSYRAAIAAVVVLGSTSAPARAGEANVIDVAVRPTGTGSFDFEVTVEHADEGWEHYADAWEVLTPDGAVLGTRTLLHPHVNEQPFTRGLSGVKIPEGIDRVRIRAHDSVHGYGGDEITIPLSEEAD